MSESVITYDVAMGRWEPNARGRLGRAALTLSAEKGYENTTVAEIAAAAGVTERTFYRYFADKADALFPDNTQLLAHLAQVVAAAVRDGQNPLDAALAAVRELAGYASQEPERALLIAQVIPAVPALVGRDLLRQRQVTDAIAQALGDKDVPILDAQLAAETAVAVWRVSGAEWARTPEGRTILDVVESTAEAARAQARPEPLKAPAT
jgi:AcrR family transcriptional regulator